MDTLRTAADVQKAGDDLETFGSLLKELPALARVLDHPGMPVKRRESILDEALSRLKPHPHSRRLLHLVVEKGRLRELPSIVAAFKSLRDARLGLTSAEVVTAVPLDAKERGAWEKALSGVAGKKVRVTYRTDGSLIGGALARVGSVVYDGSVRKQIARIRGILARP
jgi:F-type H+-transporting ATPase subunit delta